MKNNLKKTRSRMKIIGATATAVFSLASVFAGTYAWFAMNENVTATGMNIQVKGIEGGAMKSIKLIKFDFAQDVYVIGDKTLTIIDYMNPDRGGVNEYDYSKELESFGYLSAAVPCVAEAATGDTLDENVTYYTREETEDSAGYLVDSNGYKYTQIEIDDLDEEQISSYYVVTVQGKEPEWVSVTTMNVYDPIERIIKGNTFNLEELKCNSIYEVTVYSSELVDDCFLSINASTFSPSGKTKDDVLLSDCVDFDIFFETDLTTDSVDLTSPTAIYNWISNASSEIGAGNHPNFYTFDHELEEKPTNISLLTNAQKTTRIRSNNFEFKFYLNVNYSPTQAHQYADRIQSFSNNIAALYDFTINFLCSPEGYPPPRIPD